MTNAPHNAPERMPAPTAGQSALRILSATLQAVVDILADELSAGDLARREVYNRDVAALNEANARARALAEVPDE